MGALMSAIGPPRAEGESTDPMRLPSRSVQVGRRRLRGRDNDPEVWRSQLPHAGNVRAPLRSPLEQTLPMTSRSAVNSERGSVADRTASLGAQCAGGPGCGTLLRCERAGVDVSTGRPGCIAGLSRSARCGLRALEQSPQHGGGVVD